MMKNKFLSLSIGLLLCGGLLAQVVDNVSVTVNWANKVGNIRADHWGVNDYNVKNQTSYDPHMIDLFKQVKPGVVRLHQAGLVKEWSNNSTQSWDINKISTRLGNNYPGYGDARIMINLSDWPNFISTEGILPLEKHAELAAYYAQLPAIFKQLGFRVDYYEFINENDENYEGVGKYEQYCELVRDCAKKIKEEVAKLNLDYTVKVGGPALRWPKEYWYKTFIDIAGKDVDFFSWHHYATGPIGTGVSEEQRNVQIFENVNWMTSAVTNIMNYARSKNCGHLETYLDEFNVQYVWTPYEPRHHNNVGAVWYASVIRRLALTELTGAANWNFKDGAYGLSRGGSTISAPGSLYVWGGKYLRGDIYSYTSSVTTVEVMPVNKPGEGRAVLFINRSANHRKIGKAKDILNVASTADMQALSIDASIQQGDNWIPVLKSAIDDTIRMAPWSLVLLTNIAASTFEQVENLQPLIVLDDAVKIGWSNPNTGVKGFSIRVDGELKLTTMDTTAWVLGLEPGMQKEITVSILNDFLSEVVPASILVETLETPLIINDRTSGEGLHLLTWDSNWSPVVNSSAYNGELTRTATSGAFMETSFHGTSLALFGKGNSSTGGRLKIIIDGVERKVVDFKKDVESNGYFYLSNLMDDELHTLRLEVDGAGEVAIDQIRVYSPRFSSDVQPPAQISKLNYITTYKSIVITWQPPFDNSGIQGYVITLDGVDIDTVYSPGVVIDQLEPNTLYQVGILAFDPRQNFSSPYPINAQTKNLEYTNILKTGTAPTIDGIMDPLWESCETFTINHDSDGQVIDPAGTVRLLWDNGFLYLFVEVYDEEVIGLSGSSIAQGDGIELFIDGGNDKAGIYGNDDFWFIISANSTYLENYKGKSANIKTALTTKGYNVEAAFRWTTALNAYSVASGYIMGMEVHINNLISEGGDLKKYTWHPLTQLAGFNTALLGSLKLSGDFINSTNNGYSRGNLKLYPNPAQSYIKINFMPGDAANYRVLSIDGNVVLSGSTSGTGTELDIDISSLVPGYYLVEVTSIHGQRANGGFVKQ